MSKRPLPIKEEYFLTGPLEATNRAYALAKISGIEMCWSYNRQSGAPRKLLDAGKLARLGWKASTPLERGCGWRMRIFSLGRLAEAKPKRR